MTGRVTVMRKRGLITASGHADAVKAKHDDKHSGAVDPAVVDHGSVVGGSPEGLRSSNRSHSRLHQCGRSRCGDPCADGQCGR